MAAPALFACSKPGQIAAHPQNWFSIRAPSFSVGPQAISSFAVEFLRPQNLYVTNGTAVMGSQDGGCSWDESFVLGSAGPPDIPGAESQILEIEAGAPGVVYLPIQERTPAGARPRLFRSSDSGASWQAADDGLLSSLTGTLVDFDAPLSDGAQAFALVDIENQELGSVASYDTSQTLLETADAGQTWTARTVFDGNTEISALVGGVTIQSSEGEFQGLTADPARPGRVWLYGEGDTLISNPGAATPASLRNIGVLEISPDGGLVVAYDKVASTGYLSLDAGASFDPFDTLTTVSSAAPIGPILIGTESLGRSFLHLPPPGAVVPQVAEFTPENGTRISQMEPALFNGPLFYGHTQTSVEVHQLLGRPDPVKSLPTPPLVDLEKDPGILKPAHKRVRLRPGRAETIPYRLALPSAPTPLDVYFLIDVSGSMGGTINGVRSAMQEIVERLSALDIDVAFGVGAFRAFNDPPAYARVRDIGPPDDSLRRALDSLNASGGGDETQMAALYESVTGAGEASIEPGLNMHFRPGSLRVAILSTDEPISRGNAHPPPSKVIDALVDADVKQVALAIQDSPLLGEPDYDDPGEPASTLQDVAKGSRAIAPAGGVDCDGDDEPEIAEGGPIVCLIPPSRADEADLMADAIVAVLNAIQDIQDVAATVSPVGDVEGGSDIVESVSPGLFPARNLKEAQDFGFSVTVRCPEVQRDGTHPLSVSVGTSGLELGEASLIVECDAPAVAKREEPEAFPVTAFVPLVGLPLPPPRPPDPVVEPNPNPQPNPQNNPGMASQEQKQPQAAVAHQEGQLTHAPEEAGEDQFLMTHHSEKGKGPTPGAIFLISAATMTVIYGFATQWREQVRTQHARGGPRRYR